LKFLAFKQPFIPINFFGTEKIACSKHRTLLEPQTLTGSLITNYYK